MYAASTTPSPITYLLVLSRRYKQYKHQSTVTPVYCPRLSPREIRHKRPCSKCQVCIFRVQTGVSLMCFRLTFTFCSVGIFPHVDYICPDPLSHWQVANPRHIPLYQCDSSCRFRLCKDCFQQMGLEALSTTYHPLVDQHLCMCHLRTYTKKHPNGRPPTTEPRSLGDCMPMHDAITTTIHHINAIIASFAILVLVLTAYTRTHTHTHTYI